MTSEIRSCTDYSIPSDIIIVMVWHFYLIGSLAGFNTISYDLLLAAYYFRPRYIVDCAASSGSSVVVSWPRVMAAGANRV